MRGPEAAHHAPPLPLRPKRGERQTEETAAPHPPPRRGRCTRGEGALRPRQAPLVNSPHARALPVADRLQTGGAQDGANRAAPSEAGLGRAGARTRAGGLPPPPSPPRRTDPLAADRAAPDAHGGPATPTARVYPRGGRQRQRMAGRRPTGRGGGGQRSSPPGPPPAPPPRLRAIGATLRPPGAERRPPSPRRDHDAGGGVRLDLHTACLSAPSRLLPRGSRPTGEPTPACRSSARTKPGGGTRRRTRTVWGPRPP